MRFRLRPILSEIKELYAQPISAQRFQAYISKLQGGSKGDLALPISGFNPMAKPHVLAKIEELEQLEAEKWMAETITEFNASLDQPDQGEFMVVLNLADDLKGGWTNYYATDFDSKFKLNAFVRRRFCVPYFWTSESYSEAIIRTRTLEYLKRTVYRATQPQPQTLADHLEQEIFSASLSPDVHSSSSKPSLEAPEAFFSTHRDSTAPDLIFNFFYGDEGSANLGYKTYGIIGMNGFEYARILAARREGRV